MSSFIIGSSKSFLIQYYLSISCTSAHFKAEIKQFLNKYLSVLYISAYKIKCIDTNLGANNNVSITWQEGTTESVPTTHCPNTLEAISANNHKKSPDIITEPRDHKVKDIMTRQPIRTAPNHT